MKVFKYLLVLTCFSITCTLSYSQSENTMLFFKSAFEDTNAIDDSYNRFFAESFKKACNLERLKSIIGEIKIKNGNSGGVIMSCVSIDSSHISLTDFNLKSKQDRNWIFFIDSNFLITGFRIVLNSDCVKIKNEIDTSRFGYDMSKTLVEKNFEINYKISLPKKEKEVSLVLLLQGSGPNNADYVVANSSYYKDISRMLLKRNIASIRIDKRSVHFPNTVTTIENEQIVDAIAVVRKELALCNQRISKIYIIGHSLGGLSALKIAKTMRDTISKVILLSYSPRNIFSIMKDQLDFLNKNNFSPLEVDSLYRQVKYAIDSFSISSPKSRLPFSVSPVYWQSLFALKPDSLIKEMSSLISVFIGLSDYHLNSKDIDLWCSLIDKKRVHLIKNVDHFLSSCSSPYQSAKKIKIKHSVFKSILNIFKSRGK